MKKKSATQSAFFNPRVLIGLVLCSGQSSATVILHAVVDHHNENSETAIMTLTSGTGYTVPSNFKKATVTIPTNHT